MLKVGIIGLGSISKHHIRAYKNNPLVDIVALCDPNQQRLLAVGEELGVKQLYLNYQELLENKEVDAVSICTWNNTHAPISIEALRSEKHVLVEKPLSLSLKGAEAVQAEAEHTDKVASIGMVRRYADNARLLKAAIEKDELGEIYYAKATFLRRLGHPGGWFGDRSKSGGGPLMDLGVHLIDICWFLMGKPRVVSVSGSTYAKLGRRESIHFLSSYKAADQENKTQNVEELATAFIRFDNGATLTLDTSFTLHLSKDEMAVKLFGDKGGAELEPQLKMVKEANQAIMNIEPQMDYSSFHMATAFQNEVNHFVSAVVNQTENITPVRDGVEVMRIVEAIYRSAKEKREITF